jgi:hypothetical protein
VQVAGTVSPPAAGAAVAGGAIAMTAMRAPMSATKAENLIFRMFLPLKSLSQVRVLIPRIGLRKHTRKELEGL